MRFQSALKERLNTLGGGSMSVCVPMGLPKQQMVSIKLLLLLEVALLDISRAISHQGSCFYQPISARPNPLYSMR